MCSEPHFAVRWTILLLRWSRCRRQGDSNGQRYSLLKEEWMFCSFLTKSYCGCFEKGSLELPCASLCSWRSIGMDFMFVSLCREVVMTKPWTFGVWEFCSMRWWSRTQYGTVQVRLEVSKRQQLLSSLLLSSSLFSPLFYPLFLSSLLSSHCSSGRSTAFSEHEPHHAHRQDGRRFEDPLWTVFLCFLFPYVDSACLCWWGSWRSPWFFQCHSKFRRSNTEVMTTEIATDLSWHQTSNGHARLKFEVLLDCHCYVTCLSCQTKSAPLYA